MATNSITTPINGLLIFLDDLESNDHLGVVTSGFLKAIVDQAGPIVASASVIVNAQGNALIREKDLHVLARRYKQLADQDDPLTEEESQEVKDIGFSVARFNDQKAKNWVIKKINSALYLLIPKQYIEAKNIALKDVMVSFKEPKSKKGLKSVTPTELKLGLKVNHMKTATLIGIKKPTEAFNTATYFMKAVWDSNNQNSSIFVTNKEYAAQCTQPFTWALYITGHGSFGKRIVNMSLSDFKLFLSFLETKIHTSLLYYDACYAAGYNSKTIYEERSRLTAKAYPFTIITQALTDAPTLEFLISVYWDDNALLLDNIGKFSTFFTLLESGIIDYRRVIAALTPKFKYEDILALFGVGGVPQVKIPGVEWFSVMDKNTVSIGSTLAKYRKKPLSIANFFARKGKQSDPYALLLYADDIPFELIIDTQRMPIVVSMIPGKAEHHIAKVSSAIHSIDTLINGFLDLEGPIPSKIFRIDQLTGVYSDAIGNVLNLDTKDTVITLHNLVLMTPSANREYAITFTYNDKTYTISEL